MKKLLMLVVAGLLLASPVFANDDKGSMKGSDYEHKSDENKEAVQDAMHQYIEENSTEGVLTLEGKNLSFIKLHDKVGMKDDLHYSCADFKDLDSGETIDVDLFVDVTDGDISVTNAKVHEVVVKKAKETAEKKVNDIAEDKGSIKGSDHENKGSGY